MTKGRKPGISKRSFMLVTNDKYEHPISQPMGLNEMAIYLGKTVRYILYSVTPAATARRKQYNKPSKKWAIVAFQEDEVDE